MTIKRRYPFPFTAFLKNGVILTLQARWNVSWMCWIYQIYTSWKKSAHKGKPAVLSHSGGPIRYATASLAQVEASYWCKGAPLAACDHPVASSVGIILSKIQSGSNRNHVVQQKISSNVLFFLIS